MPGESVSPLTPRSSSSCGIWGSSRRLFSVAILFCVLLSSCEAKSLQPQSESDTQQQPKPTAAEVAESGEAKSAAAAVTSGVEANGKSGSEKSPQRNLEESPAQPNSASPAQPNSASSAEESTGSSELATQPRGEWKIGKKPFYYKVVEYFNYWKPHQTQETETDDVAATDSTDLPQPNSEESSAQSLSSASPEGQSTDSSELTTTPKGKWVMGRKTSLYKMLNYFTYWQPYQTQEAATESSELPEEPQGRWVLNLFDFASNAVRFIYRWTGSADAFNGVEVKEIVLDDDDESTETTESSSTVAPTANPQETESNADDEKGGIQIYLADHTDEKEEQPEDEISSVLREKRAKNRRKNSAEAAPKEEEYKDFLGTARALSFVLLVLVCLSTAVLAVSHYFVLRKPIPSKDESVSIPELFFNEGSSDASSALASSFLTTDPTLADVSIAICEKEDPKLTKV